MAALLSGTTRRDRLAGGHRACRAARHPWRGRLRCGRDQRSDPVPGESKAIAERLAVGIALLAGLLETDRESQRVGEMLSLATNLLDHEGLSPATHDLLAALARGLGCERVALGIRRGRRIRVVALSNSVRFNAHSDGIRDLRWAMEEALDQDAWIELPLPQDSTPVASERHRALLLGSGARSACTLPLAARGHPVGAITFEWENEGAVTSEIRSGVREIGLLAGPIIELLARAEAGVVERGRARFVRSLRESRSQRRCLSPPPGSTARTWIRTAARITCLFARCGAMGCTRRSSSRRAPATCSTSTATRCRGHRSRRRRTCG